MCPEVPSEETIEGNLKLEEAPEHDVIGRETKEYRL